MAEDLLPLMGHNIGGDDESESDSNEEDIAAETEESVEEDENYNNAKKQKKKKKDDDKKRMVNFDKSLPTAHSYLGTDLEDVRGRTIHDDDSCVTIPLLALPGVVLVPGQTIPLHLFQHHMVAMIKNVAEKDKTFGVITFRYQSEHTPTLSNLGTTAEIFSIKDETDDISGISTVRVKAKGRQRFEVIDTHREVTGILAGKVRILPECLLTDSLSGARPRSLCKFCCNPADQDSVVKTAVDRQGNVLASVSMVNNLQVNKFSCANFTWWPPWVYKMYDTKNLSEKILRELQSWNEALRVSVFPQDPTELSYWVAQNLPLDDSMRLHLLGLNSAVQRLRCELSIIQKCTVLCCKDCGTQITHKNEVFSMSMEGPLGAYVNPGGHVHETLTVYKIQNLGLIGRPSTEHSWFPGYAWTIVECKHCSSHMGWRFTASNKSLNPQKFWGLCRASLIPGIQNTDDTEEEWMPVM
ncbi:protein cereblon-like [Haliotis cracherodii]|uniref:protein cereblon-like n=1 Tax=Haliotis cracherodii TaxID=6455 RepID=UPI0039EC9400